MKMCRVEEGQEIGIRKDYRCQKTLKSKKDGIKDTVFQKEETKSAKWRKGRRKQKE
jgi:hypothetical protein